MITINEIGEGDNLEYTLEQALKDILFLGRRQKALEEAMCEWSEFMTLELLKQGIRINKHKTTFNFFRKALGDTHKRNFEELEILTQRVQALSKRDNKYTIT